MENIITWDFMGWKEHSEPEVGLQLKWNKSLIDKIYEVSDKIRQVSLRSGVDTITMSPALEGILHPDFYDNHRKLLNGDVKVILDESIDKYVIKLENLKALETLDLIPEIGEQNEVVFLPLNECDEERIINYIEGLVGFIIIDNLHI